MKKFILAVSLLVFTVATFAQTPAPPVISPAPGPFTGSVTVTITEATPGYEIHYTVDNSAPVASWPLYTGPFTVSVTTTVRAVAVVIPASAVSSAIYTLNVTPPPTTFPYVLGSNTQSFNFTWTVGGATPPSLTALVGDSSPCPPPAGVPTCHWAVTASSDVPWLVVTSGTTSFTTTVTVNTAAITGPGTFLGNVIFTQAQFKQPVLKIPVKIVVAGNTPPPAVHSVSLSWSSPLSLMDRARKFLGMKTTVALDGYNVYRSTMSGGSYQKINAALVTATNFTDSGVTAGAKYFYVATSVASGQESVNSAEASAAIPTP